MDEVSTGFHLSMFRKMLGNIQSLCIRCRKDAAKILCDLYQELLLEKV